MSTDITSFKGEYRFLSNFWPANVMYEGVVYPSVENAYVAAKTDDVVLRKEFTGITPGEAKRIGKTLILRSGWDSMKLSIMFDLVRQKFQHADLKEKLLATGERLIIEGNTWGDVYWGVCDGYGLNNLGIILMTVRKEVQ
jgi:ribA/ribD-fused uncharacterized protein